MTIVRSAIERDALQSAKTAAGRTSVFWVDMLAERPNYPSINEITVFRRENFAYGIGHDRQGGLEQERDYSGRIHHIFRRMVSADFVARVPESSFGAPLAFEHDGILRSAAFWIQSVTARRTLDFVGEFGKRGPLRVLEIGAGWGACAYQLHHVLEVENYLIVDIPENLYMSTLYLSSVLPNRQLDLVDVAGPTIRAIETNAIAACLPGAIERIEAKFDLVLNSFSLQEMDLESVQAYIDWVATVLSDEGIFVSLNSHAKAGVRNPSDYGYRKFHIHHWGVFRKCPPGYFNTIPYEVVLGRRRSDSPRYSDDVQDVLGWLMQSGLDQELEGLCKRFTSGALGTEDEKLIASYCRFFLADNDADRRVALKEASAVDNSPMTAFVGGQLAMVCGDPNSARALFADACSRGLAGFARVRAEVLLAAIANRRNQAPKLAPIDGFDPTYAYPEVAKMLASGDAGSAVDHANRVLRRA
jgi:hypothetical protein